MVGKAEVDKVIGKDEDKEVGFLLVQDWKWFVYGPFHLI